ncbi:MAG: hypothetical protein J1G02_06275 [Clostridiales bacterium]|nr:hypothetical protein [Clostridiales bacterium]
MNNCKKCKQNCGTCKFALVVESFDEHSYMECPTIFSNMEIDGELERQALLGIYQWCTPMVTLCYLPEGMECDEVRFDKTLLSKTHPQIFIEQMTDLYEGIPLEMIEQFVTDELEKAKTIGLNDTEQLWHKIHSAIYERKTAKAVVND